jgi:chorismate--pyruvate lyase
MALPRALRAWLIDPTSLTDRIRGACAGAFCVRVLREGYQRPRLDESKVLGIRRGRFAWVREVQLLCDAEPWVFARTVIPLTSLTGPQRRLAHLGNRPLGAYLFAHPATSRGLVEVASIRRGQAMFAQAVVGVARPGDRIWGRRSVFRVNGKPLLVTEVFLPGLPADADTGPRSGQPA